MRKEDQEYVPWKRYTFAVTETLLTFTFASFLLGLYIMRYGNANAALSAFIGIVYAAIVVFSIYRMVRQFSLSAVMLMIPIAPLIVLGIVVSLIHLLQIFK